jgi:competence CoiA-like predicted nuclease
MNYILGVINKETSKYENIIFVEKSNKYKCIGCESDLILRKGDKNFQSFVHKNKNSCQYFKNPSTEQLLNDAKLYLEILLEQNNVNIFRKCEICKKKCKMNNINNIEINYYDKNNNIISKSEIYHSKESEIYQINMLDLIHTCVQDFTSKKIELVCSKNMICNECNIRYKKFII